MTTETKEVQLQKARAVGEALRHIADTPVPTVLQSPELTRLTLMSLVGTARNVLAFCNDEVTLDEYCDIEAEFAKSVLLAGAKSFIGETNGASNDDAPTQQAA